VSILANILRHPDENLAKCTLQPIVGRSEFHFLTAQGDLVFDGTGMILLEVGAPLLSSADAGRQLLLLDANWKHIPLMRKRIVGQPVPRSLPALSTAYPRRNKAAKDPCQGLASIEALYWALRLLGHDDPSLLLHYHWRQEFLQKVEELAQNGVR
jgi:pre-rRNA-processing protein TSR3